MTTKCTCTKDGFNDAGVDTYGCPLHSTPTVEEKREITPIEMAIITLATYLEDPSHDDYKVKEHILEILGLGDVNVLEI